MMEIDEARLIKRLRARDEGAFREFVRAYEQQVYNLVYRMIGDPEEARDLSQEIFVSVFRGIESFRGDARLSTWLYRIATNHCHNRQKFLARRAHGRRDEYDDSRSQEGGRLIGERLPGPEGLAVGRRFERAVQAAIAKLDPEQRKLLVLRDIQGCSYQEIQQITELAEGTMKSRLHSARGALKEILAPMLSEMQGGTTEEDKS